jgi:hypothetical protein
MKRILTAAALALTLGAPIAAYADDSVALVTAWQAATRNRKVRKERRFRAAVSSVSRLL